MGTLKHTLFFLLLVTQISFAQWVQTNGPDGSCLTANGNNIFVGTTSGVYLSTDNGNSWTQTTLNNRDIISLTNNGSNIFAGTYENGVYRSTDNGNNWTQTTLNNEYVSSIYISEDNIYTGTGYDGMSHIGGIYLSTNNGDNWTHIGLNNRTVDCIAKNENNIFAGTGIFGVYRSTDNGSTWDQTSLTAEGVYSIVFFENTILAGTFFPSGIYRSTNNGNSWSQTLSNNSSCQSLFVYENKIFAGTELGAYLSNDSGKTWTEINEGFGSTNAIMSLEISGDYIFACASYNSIWKRPLSEIIVTSNDVSSEIPSKFSLEQNYPNPFNPSTKIKYQIPELSFVTLKVYNVLGSEVAALVNEEKPAGSYVLEFNGTSFPSGIYFYQLKAGSLVETKKMVLLQ